MHLSEKLCNEISVEKKRNITFDFIRTVAIISVVWIHCQEQSGINIHIVGTMTYLFGRMGVPLFIMLMGALLISSSNSNILKFYRKRLIPIYALSVIWLFFYRLGVANITENIKLYTGMSQQKIADMIGVSRQQVQRVIARLRR